MPTQAHMEDQRQAFDAEKRQLTRQNSKMERRMNSLRDECAAILHTKTSGADLLARARLCVHVAT